MMVSALLLSLGAVAKDLGRMGPTFPIGEIDMLTWIEARLKPLEATGKPEQPSNRVCWASETKRGNTAAAFLIDHDHPKTFLVDPSITVPKDLTDAQGRVFAKAGTRVNPFDTRTSANGRKITAV
ncbi:hypothetical protein BCU32_024340 [Vibrio lentus]|uniref:hypothetical protein n=1 Tax=Vibrio lentus TaxID=136468 RepID=UPI0039A538EA